MTRRNENSSSASWRFTLVVLAAAAGCVGELSDASTEAQALLAASPEDDAAAVGVTTMKLLSAQCTSVGQDVGQFGNYSVPIDASGSSLCWLDRGSVGPAVEALQRALVLCWIVQDLEVDGDYGPMTRDAVRTVQRLLDLPDDGVYGPQTRTKMGDGFGRVALEECAAPHG